MDRKNVFVHDAVQPEALAKLQSLPQIRLEVVEDKEETEVWTIPEAHARDTHVLFSCETPTNLDEMDSLKLIQISSAGYAQLCGLDLPGKGIRACNAAGVFDAPISEWNFTMIVNLARDIRGMIRNQEAGTWDRAARFQCEINGLVVGIWGYGGIGRATAHLCKAAGMIVHAMDCQQVGPRTNFYCPPHTGDPDGTLPDRVFSPDQTQEFLGGLDFLVVAMPLSESTRGIVGEAELKALRPTAFVLNPARGPIIQEESLVRALREGWIAGAALDTHYYYPMPPDHPLWSMPNVIMTPHISGSNLSPHFLKRLWEIFSENVVRFVDDRPLLNELTAAQLAG